MSARILYLLRGLYAGQGVILMKLCQKVLSFLVRDHFSLSQLGLLRYLLKRLRL